MAKITGETHWRDSARNARFFIIDARAVFPLLLWLVHIRWWTFEIAIVMMIFFGALERYGFSPQVFARYFRNLLAGGIKSCRPWWQE